LAELRAALGELEASVAKLRARAAVRPAGATGRRRGSDFGGALLDDIDDAPPSMARRLRRPLRVLAAWLLRSPANRK
jgi:hypothetical protein